MRTTSLICDVIPEDAMEDLDRDARLDERRRDILDGASALLAFVKAPRSARLAQGRLQLRYEANERDLGDLIRSVGALIRYIETGIEHERPTGRPPAVVTVLHR